MSEVLVRAEQLEMVYRNGTRAVEDVSFEIPRGSTLGLVGESGSGKSTVAAMLLRLEEPTSGRVWFRGEDITHERLSRVRAVRRHMQLVMQDPVSALNRRKTIRQIIVLPLRLHGAMTDRQMDARAQELMDIVKMPASLLSRYPHQLSGGQCQRVGIARALALNPDFIVLDEAVSAVDALVQAQILTLLKQLQNDLGLTFLFVSHDLAVVRYMASEIVVMRSGRVVETGDREQIFESPRQDYTKQLLASAPAVLAEQHIQTYL